MTKEAMGLRERVARSLWQIDVAGTCFQDEDFIPERYPTYMSMADAAIVAVLEAMPDEIDLFRILRRAGRKDADKARSIDAMLTAFRAEALHPDSPGGK